MIAFHPVNKAYYVAKYKTGELVGLDRDSGGYPFKISYPSQIHYWHDIDEALKYVQMFRKDIDKIIAVYGLFDNE